MIYQKLQNKKALNKLVKGEITAKEYHDIKNLYHEPVITTNNTLWKSIISPINYKIEHKKIN